MPEEISACAPFLSSQIQELNPPVIAPMGRFAMQYVFKKYGLPEQSISAVHGKEFQVNTLHGEKTIFPLFHPAVATYDPNKKSVLLEDFKKLARLL
jgi:DNA polymerase